MKKSHVIALAGLLGLAIVTTASAQVELQTPVTLSQPSGLKHVLSDHPFFGTSPVLTLNGDYVNSPKEDFEESGIWRLPLTLEEMHGVIGEVAFGEAEKQGNWQLSYKWKLMTMDSSWQSFADANPSLTLSDRRNQVLKANYNVRDWWQLGVGTFTDDRSDGSGGLQALPFEINKSQSLGFQLDATIRF